MAEPDAGLHAELIATAHALADAARPVTLQHFRQPATIAENKLTSGFDPVTVADRGSETAMRELLAVLRPDDGILGEEFGPVTGTSGLTWVLDPIDGTRGYISGTPTWGVLVAVNAGEGPLYGIIDQPYICERFAGGFGEAYVDGPSGRAGLKVRALCELSDCILLTTFPEIGTPAEGRAFRAVADKVKLTRYGMDCYGYALLAAGQVDLVIEAGLSAYDVQAPIAVVQAAGGIVTDWQGGPVHAGGQVIAAGSEALHKAALALLATSPG
jgi:histidinol phosphatase-like enzyme (inositol monophosphatase family)